MSEGAVIKVSDYEREEGRIEVSVQEPNWTEKEMVRISVKDHDCNAIVYPTIEQAQELVMTLLKAIHEAKHGNEENPDA